MSSDGYISERAQGRTVSESGVYTGERYVNVWKCLRAIDIELVGGDVEGGGELGCQEGGMTARHHWSRRDRRYLVEVQGRGTLYMWRNVLLSV